MSVEKPEDRPQAESKPSGMMTFIKYANLFLAVGTLFLGVVTKDWIRLLMVPLFLAVFFSVK